MDSGASGENNKPMAATAVPTTANKIDRLDKSFGKDVDQEDNQNSDSAQETTIQLGSLGHYFPYLIATGIKVKTTV